MEGLEFYLGFGPEVEDDEGEGDGDDNDDSDDDKPKPGKKWGKPHAFKH